MTNKVVDGPKARSRKLWDKHGSYLILVFVVGVAFNGGAEWQNWKMQHTIETIVSSGVAERDGLRVRLRSLSEEYRVLSAQCTPAALGKADQAINKAGEAVDKASKAVEKADQILENTK